jgi:diguanylate cyclase (GGDEF)-like protein
VAGSIAPDLSDLVPKLANVVARVLAGESTPHAALALSQQAMAFSEAIVNLAAHDNPTTTVLDQVRQSSEAFGTAFADINDAVGTANALLTGLCEEVSPLRPWKRQLRLTRALGIATFEVLSFAVSAYVDLHTLNPVTHLPARARFERDLATTLAACNETGDPLAVMLADIDDLKALNDREGYEYGDRALAGFAEVARSECDTEGVSAYHWGGDEFSLMLRGQSAADSEAMIGRLKAGAARMDRYGIQREVGFSAAIAEWPVDGLTANALVGAAGDRVRAIKRERRVGREFRPPG